MTISPPIAPRCCLSNASASFIDQSDSDRAHLGAARERGAPQDSEPETGLAILSDATVCLARVEYRLGYLSLRSGKYDRLRFDFVKP